MDLMEGHRRVRPSSSEAVGTAFGLVPPGLDGLGVEGLSIDTPLGLVLLVVAAFVAFKAAKLAVKLAMLPVLLAGLYLWLGL